jgi:hypothetical protein
MSIELQHSKSFIISVSLSKHCGGRNRVLTTKHDKKSVTTYI